MVRYIIINDLIPGLISGGKGFYIATKRSELEECIQSLNERINAIEIKRTSWMRQMESLFIQESKIFK